MNIKTLLEIVRTEMARPPWPPGTFPIIHLKAGRPPLLRIVTKIFSTANSPLSSEDIMKLIQEMVGTERNQKRLEKLNKDHEVHFSYFLQSEDKNIAGFRIDAFRQDQTNGAVIRVIPKEIPTIENLRLPLVLKELSLMSSGLIVIAGPARCGKSTTSTTIIDHINKEMPVHIITIEDPIEFIHKDRRSIVNQREIGRDAESFSSAIEQALRHDPDVLFVGEMRDTETILATLGSAETGCLVITTLPTIETDVASAINQLIDSFPREKQDQIRLRLSFALKGALSQKLSIEQDGSVKASFEVIVSNPDIQKAIREGSGLEIRKAIQKGTQAGMQTLDQ
ncbi:MAG: PilT/PilU family type 4a pilus ATPase [bacterium]|nr:PilT/PilU family type 4a pilus ATPase [bacterium]